MKTQALLTLHRMSPAHNISLSIDCLHRLAIKSVFFLSQLQDMVVGMQFSQMPSKMAEALECAMSTLEISKLEPKRDHPVPQRQLHVPAWGEVNQRQSSQNTHCPTPEDEPMCNESDPPLSVTAKKPCWLVRQSIQHQVLGTTCSLSMPS